MDISTVRSQLAAAGTSIPGLTCTGYVPDAITEPHWYAGEVEIDPKFTFGGAWSVTVTCRILVSAADDRAGQTALDTYLSQTGPRSLFTALAAARGAPGELALGGAADDFVVETIGGYRMYQVGADSYFGAEFKIRVLGS